MASALGHPPRRGRNRAAARRRDLCWLAAGLGGLGLASALLVAPSDAVQGDVQRLMYLHVPAAWTGYLAFLVALVCGLRYLVCRELRFDRYGRAAAEIGVAATSVTIAVGSVWGRAVWGVWWTWDPRLVSTALLLVGYVGSLAARLADDDPHAGARRAALVGAVAFTLVPVTHFSVVWWRSLHQPATILAPDLSPPIDPLMATTLLLCVLAFLAGAARLFLWRLSPQQPVVSAPPTSITPRTPSGSSWVRENRPAWTVHTASGHGSEEEPPGHRRRPVGCHTGG